MKCRFAIYALLFLTACAGVDAPEIPEEQTGADATYVQGEIRLFFSEEMAEDIEHAVSTGSLVTKSAGLNDAFAGLGVKKIERLFPHAGEFEPRTRKEGLHRWYIVEYDAAKPATKAEAGFTGIPGVEIAEPVIEARPTVFNDLDSRLWGLNNSDYPGVDINVQHVWDNYTTGSSEVIVAVIDEGIQLDHEDLAANCATEDNYNFCDDNKVIVPGNHGTHVAGTIAGVSNNEKGIAGIAGGDAANGLPGVTLMSCQVFKNLSDGSVKQGNKAAAMKWAADHGAVISQNSWGYSFDYDSDGRITGDEYTAAIEASISKSDKDAVDYFIKYAGCDNEGNQLPDSPMKGGVVIFAAGNDALPNGAPANYGPIIAVGAIAQDGSRASFTNYGDWVDICAPGDGIYSTTASGSYGHMSGTSMACPHVSGVAALIVSYCGGQGFTNDLLVEKLLGGMNTEIIPANQQIGGLVDAMGAVSYGSDAVPENVAEISVKSRSNSLGISWDAVADSDGKPAYGYYVFISDDKAELEKATVQEHDKVRMDIVTSAAQVGEKVEHTVSALDFETEYHVKVVAYSYNMKTSGPSAVASAKTEPNNAPVISADNTSEIVLKSNEEEVISFTFSEPDGHKFSISHESGSAAERFTDNLDGRWLLTISARLADPGVYTAKIKATDEYGCEAVCSIRYEILENRPPQSIKSFENILMKKSGEEVAIDLKEYFKDEDGEQLRYTCTSSDEKTIYAGAKGDDLYITATGYGKADVSVTAKDAKGESCTMSFKVAVRNSQAPVDIYPNPVIDNVFIATEQDTEIQVQIVSSTGRTVYEGRMESSLFDPAGVDMSGHAPGLYSISVNGDGINHTGIVTKL